MEGLLKKLLDMYVCHNCLTLLTHPSYDAGYFDCHGFARLLLNSDWKNELQEFPALIGFLCTSIIMTVLGCV